MLISGIQKFTLLDYPGKTACIVFAPGCNFRCGYCHNPEFVLPERIVQMKKDFIPEAALWNFLDSRKARLQSSSVELGSAGEPLLDGVVVSGGEPTMQGDLVAFIRTIKSKGFLVKLDTNGNRPDVLSALLSEKVVDYVAMDLKTDREHYQSVAGFLADPTKVAASVELLMRGTVPYEFRSTLVKELHTSAILESMAEWIAGAERWYLQPFRPAITLAPEFSSLHSYSSDELASLAASLKPRVQSIYIR